MYANVHFVDLSNTIYVTHRLWNRSTELKQVLDHAAGDWSIDKIFIEGQRITESDLERCLLEFGGYDIQIEKRK